MTADEPAGPTQFHLDAIRLAFDRHGDLFQQESRDRLAIFGRRRIGLPQRGQVVRQRDDLCALVGRKLRRAVAREADVIGLQLFVRAEGFVPTAFQFARHQAMVGIDRRVLSPRLFDFIARTRQPLLPVVVELLSLAFDVRGGRQTQLQRRGRDGLQQSLGDERFERRAGQALTNIRAVVDRLALTTVTQRFRFRRAARVAVSDQQAMPAATADQQTGQHARPVARRRQQLAQRAVFGQFPLVFLEFVPGDVGREAVPNQHAALVVRTECATG